MAYTRPEIERVSRVAFQLAQRRKRRLLSVDKANVLEVSRLWRNVITDVAKEFPDVTLTHELVDAAAMKLALAPSRYDVIVTENMFGDILSDEAGAVCGSLGLLPSASLGDGRRAVRACPRVRAGYRRQGHRQSDRHDSLGGHAAHRRSRSSPGSRGDHRGH